MGGLRRRPMSAQPRRCPGLLAARATRRSLIAFCGSGRGEKLSAASSALIYSADTLLPVVSMEMQDFWLPDERDGFGWWARVYLWVHIAVGWALSLAAVAGFSGLIKTD